MGVGLDIKLGTCVRLPGLPHTKKYHNRVASNNRNVFSHSFGGWEPKIRALVRIFLEGSSRILPSEGYLLHASLLAAGGS